MRVAVVDPLAYTPPYDHSLAAALAARGHAVELMTSRFLFGPVPAPEGYRRHELFLPLSGRLLGRAPRSRLRLLLKGAEYVPSAWRLQRRLDSLAPDVVHVQWLPLPRYDVRWLRASARRRPTIFTAHDVLSRPGERGIARWREIFSHAHRVVVHSRAAGERLASLGIERERIAHIPHAVFPTAPGRAIAPPRGRTLLFFGLLRAYKGLDVLVRALEPLARSVPDARLVVAGDPVDPVEPVQALAARLGVGDRIEWRLGFRPEDEVAELMEAAAAVVLPYRETDSSGVLATAIGHGRPVIVSDVGSLGDLVREWDAGLVVPSGDPEALASACSTLLAGDGALAAAFEGAQAARSSLTWEAAAEAHERVYAELLGR